MVRILPFRGVRYNPSRVKLEDVVAPPYDVISEEEQAGYYEKSEYNVIRLILGMERPEDTEEDNRYTRAAAHFNRWLGEGVLLRDPEPSLYVYEEEYSYGGRRRVMRGFMALGGLEEYGKGSVLPHEETLSAPVRDRMTLLQTCRANFSSIFMVYSDPSGAVEGALSPGKGELVADVMSGGVRHRLWRISNPEAIEQVKGEMEGKRVLIADGHHRYETALNFWRESGEEGHGYMLMFFTNMHSPGITILPAHRVVRGVEGFTLENLKAGLGRYFKVCEFSGGAGGLLEEMKALNRTEHAFGLYSGGSYFLLLLKDGKILDEVGDQGKSREWRRLDVSIVHSLMLKHILGVEADGGDVVYVTDEGEAVDLVEKGPYQLVIFLNPTKLEEVRDIAVRGERMPGKATYFYPKLLTGLVLNKMD